MKTKITRRLKQAASALLVALVICSIFSLFVVYYLSLIEQQNYLNSRSQTWNMAIAITEAGVEEGLEHLNDNGANLGVAPWTFLGGNTYYRSNSLPDGNSYTVFITNTLPTPIIVARAFVSSSSFISLAQNVSAGFFAAAGMNTGPATVTRAVQVNCSKTSMFRVPLVARKTINLNGNNIATDSYNSCDPTKSVNGQYAPGFYSGDLGDIASNLGLVDSISGGNANIYGHAHTGTNTSGQATVTLGPNGAVGEHSWQSGHQGIEPGWVLEDANFTFPDTTFPSTSGYMTATGGVLVVTSNAITSWSTNTAFIPNPLPYGGLITNNTPVTVGSWLAVPIPAPAGTTTNSNQATVSSWAQVPIPTPSGTITNTSSTTTSSYPSPGIYIGGVVTNMHGHNIDSYTYNLISGFSYPTYTYTYPTYTYTYSLYSTNVIYRTNSYDHILWGTADLSQTNCYVANSLSGNTVVVGNNVVLALPNGLSMSGGDSFTIMPSQNVPSMSSLAPPGAGVQVYSGGTSCSIGGNGVINQPGYPGSFILYCAPTVTSFSLSGNGGFTGILVAPSVDLSLNGGGNNVTDFIGCAMVNSATLNGHFHFHFDECLLNYKNNPRYLITSWNEIP
ncbi:MAG TPA: hypothetical protein VFE51_06830 [Verrucomicrobiae bacterium]|nr:hypothetical protein [Verrucomicrobiae bacterium]